MGRLTSVRVGRRRAASTGGNPRREPTSGPASSGLPALVTATAWASAAFSVVAQEAWVAPTFARRISSPLHHLGGGSSHRGEGGASQDAASGGEASPVLESAIGQRVWLAAAGPHGAGSFRMVHLEKFILDGRSPGPK